MKISDLIFENEYLFSTAELSAKITAISRHEAMAGEKTLLFILNGKKISNLSGAKEASCTVVCEELCEELLSVPHIVVKNVRRAYSFATSRFYKINYENLTLIGVTGTNGKTTTATLISKVLQSEGNKVGFIGTGKIQIGDIARANKYYSMTTPDPEILYKELKIMEDTGCKYVVMEVSSHALALEKVAPIPFKYAVFTNLSPEHLDFHKDMESYFSSKKKLIEASEKCVINIDDRYGRRLYGEYYDKALTVGAIFRGNVYGTNIESRGFDGISYIYRGSNFLFKMNSTLAGIYNVYNTMLAAAVCIDIGIAPCRVKKSIREIKSVSGRYEIIRGSVTVIIDYAHTGEAFEAVLKSIKEACKGTELTVVFGCGGERDKEKRPKMAGAAERYAERVIVTEDNSRGESPENIISDITKGFKNTSYEVVLSRKEAIQKAILEAKDGSAVAIIGKGDERYNIDRRGYSDFSEREIIKEALNERESRREAKRLEGKT